MRKTSKYPFHSLSTHTKRYSKTFTVPQTFSDPTLLLSPHIILLGILFHHKVFQVEGLVSPEQLQRLDIHRDELELPLPIKDNMKDIFVFRDVVKTVTGYEMSTNKRISAQKMGQVIRRIGELLGIEHSTTAYSLRYNAANGLDQSGEQFATIPELPV